MGSVMSSKYGAPAYPQATSDASPLATTAVTSGNRPNRFSGENPMWWLVGVGAVGLGFVAFSTHARVGKLKASVSV